MSRTLRTLAVTAATLVITATPARAQAPAMTSSHATAPTPAPDPMLAAIRDGAHHVRAMFTTAADQMSDADYAFRPTPDVRSFGQLLAHVAETNYWFCSSALGEPAPASGLEKTRTTKDEVRKALLESFEYCDRAYLAMGDSTRADAMRAFRGSSRPALVLLNFRNYHSLLHWGNAITYMRLRGKVPPSA